MASLFCIWSILAFTLVGTNPVVALDGEHTQDTVAIAAEADSVLVMRFGGDLLLAEHYERAVGTDIHHAFRDFTLFRDADIGMANLECPVTVRGTQAEKPFTFRMHPRFLEAIKDAGIGMVNIANNHIYDYGAEGLFDTVDLLDSAGILHVGAGRTKHDAHSPVIIERNGWRVGFLGYYGGGEAPAAGRQQPGVARRSLKLISADVQRLKERDSADYVVVNLHWGTEKAPYPEAGQVRFARALIEAGVDAVIGHHPHVLQGIEQYREGIIVYSLGNLIFGGNSRSTYETALFEIALSSAGHRYTLIPVLVQEWRATVPDEDTVRRITRRVQERSSIFPQTIFHSQETR